jgi:hypothetical protein
MYQRDYILRLIEQMINTLAVFFGLLKKEDLSKAGDLLSNAYYELLKEEAAFFRAIPEEELTGELLEKHNYTNDHLEIVAELFNAEAELCLAQGNKTDALSWTRKSLRLFRYYDQATKTYDRKRIDKMEAMERRISELGEV